MNTSTKSAKLFEALNSGEELTSKQIKSRFKIANPSSAIHGLRMAGYPIYLNERKNSEGSYRLGKASRKLVAAGYRALARGI